MTKAGPVKRLAGQSSTGSVEEAGERQSGKQPEAADTSSESYDDVVGSTTQRTVEAEHDASTDPGQSLSRWSDDGGNVGGGGETADGDSA